MDETCCIKDKKYTPCVEPSGYQTYKWKKTILLSLRYLWNKKLSVRYVKNNGNNKDKELLLILEE